MVRCTAAAWAAFFVSCVPATADESAAEFFAKYGPRPAIQQAQKPTRQRHNGPQPSGHIHNLITHKAQRHGVPVRLAHAIASIESRYNCAARSRSNARGVMQVLPSTARGVGVSGNLFDCTTGAEAGMRYLAAIVRKHGTGCGAISLYNRGAHARPVCTHYGRTVLARM